MLVVSACTYDAQGDAQGEQGRDAQDAGELTSGYYPSECQGALVSVDHDGYSITLDVQYELHSSSDRELLNGRVVGFVWDKPIGAYWDWFIENAEVGDAVKVSFHMPSDITTETDLVPVMSIILDGSEDIYREYSRFAAQQEWERLQEQNRE
jgi:hypothetical protein